MSDFDITQRFLFDNTDVRGEMVCLTDSYAHVLAKHQYPRPVAELIGEMMAAAALLASTLKFDGLLVLQARSDGPVPLLMVECSSEGDLRGLARYDEAAVAGCASLHDLMPGGLLAMTIDPDNGQRYQGIVALDGEDLAACLSNYFASSEQLPTRFWIKADGTRARGLLLQQLPADRIKDPQERIDSWEHLLALADTLKTEELLSLDNDTLLYRLYHQDNVRLFDPVEVRFRCSCSRERSAQALVSLGLEDARRLLEEQGGHITIDCQFCNHRYRFDPADVTQLFIGGGSEAPSETVH